MIRQARLSSILPSAAALALTALAGTALAQSQSPTAPAAAPAAAPVATPPLPVSQRSTGIPQRDTLIKMTRPVTIEFKEHRLEDVMHFISEVTGADIEVFWTDDRNTVGLDKDTPISLKFEKGSALDLLEKVLDKAVSDTTGHGNSWQLTDSGTLQVGPKERLNKFKYVKLYSIADLLIEIPDYNNAPEFDLQSVLQNQSGGRGGGGGGGQSPFRNNNDKNVDRKPLKDRVDEIQQILTGLVETEQWVDNGGDGASIRYFQGSFLVNAPDYIHRQIDGYPYWPAGATRSGTTNGRRWVSIGVDTAINKVNGFANQPVTGIAGGGTGGTGGGGGGGGGTGGGGSGGGGGGGGSGGGGGGGGGGHHGPP